MSIVTSIVGSLFCCALLLFHSSFAIILMGQRELLDLVILYSWCLVIVVWLFLAMPRGYLQFVIVVVPDHNMMTCGFKFYFNFRTQHEDGQ